MGLEVHFAGFVGKLVVDDPPERDDRGVRHAVDLAEDLVRAEEALPLLEDVGHAVGEQRHVDENDSLEELLGNLLAELGDLVDVLDDLPQRPVPPGVVLLLHVGEPFGPQGPELRVLLRGVLGREPGRKWIGGLYWRPNRKNFLRP